MWVVSLSSLLPLDWRSEHDRLDSENRNIRLTRYFDPNLGLESELPTW